MSLRARLTLLCAAFLAISVGVSGFGAGLVLRATDARRDHAAVATAAQMAADLETTYVIQAANIRAYFLSGDPKSFDDYNAERTHAGSVSARLQGLLIASPLLARVRLVNDAARVWRNDAIVPLITLQQSIGQSGEVIARYWDGHALSSFQAIAVALRALRTQVAVAVVASAHKARVARDRVAQFVIGTLASMAAALVGLRLVARWWISRPIEKLAHAVKDGTLDLAARPKRGAAELVTLSAAINSSQRRLHDELEAAVRTREGLSQTAEVLMSIRAELAVTPDTMPKGWSAAAQLLPATGIVAGDCYNIDVVGSDSASLVVVDVAGHGAGSAVVALRAKELLRAAARSYDDPSEAVTWVSAQLLGLDDDMFITAFVARIDFNSGRVRFVNAGHPDALICDGVNTIKLAPTGPFIGPFAGRWVSREAVVDPGQMLVCFTDGVIEVRNEQREEFGVERLRSALRDSYGDDTESIVKRCLAEVEAFGRGRAKDDVTLAVIARSLGA